MRRNRKGARTTGEFADAWLAEVLADAVLSDQAKVLAAIMARGVYAQPPCLRFCGPEGAVVAKTAWLGEAAGKAGDAAERWAQRASAALAQRGHIVTEGNGGRQGKNEDGGFAGKTTLRTMLIAGRNFSEWAHRE